MFARLKGQRDRAAIRFDQVWVSLGFEDASRPR
jgi:hypothetical protein